MASSWNLAAQKAEEVVDTVASEGKSMWQSVVDTAAEALASGKEAVVDVAEDVYEALPDREDVVETAGDVVETVKDTASTIGDFGTSEFRLFFKNFFDAGDTVTEKSLNDTDLETLRRVVLEAKQAGRSSIDYEDFGSSQGTVLKGSMLAGLFNPDLRMARTVGGFQFKEDEDGNTIVTNTYDFNPGPKREAYHKARAEGKGEEALEVLLSAATNPVEIASIIAYDKQESLRAEGKPATTEMVFNLGKL